MFLILPHSCTSVLLVYPGSDTILPIFTRDLCLHVCNLAAAAQEFPLCKLEKWLFKQQEVHFISFGVIAWILTRSPQSLIVRSLCGSRLYRDFSFCKLLQSIYSALFPGGADTGDCPVSAMQAFSNPALPFFLKVHAFSTGIRCCILPAIGEEKVPSLWLLEILPSREALLHWRLCITGSETCFGGRVSHFL